MSMARTPELLDRIVQLPSIPDQLLLVTQGNRSWARYMERFKDVAFLTGASNQTKKTYYLRGLKKELTMRVLQNEIPNQFKDLVNLTRKHVESMEYKQETTTPRRNHTTSLEPQKRKRRSEETDNNLCFYCREPGH